MIKFADGPAEGVTLMLRRAPFFLRVVQNPKDEWDALDQLDDAPLPSDRIVVYAKVKDGGNVHVLVRGKNRKACGWYAVADYAVWHLQPGDKTLRDKALWQSWCEAHAVALAEKVADSFKQDVSVEAAAKRYDEELRKEAARGK